METIKEKKEIGKLIELLNKYEKVREKSEFQKLSNKEYKWFSSYFFPLCFGHKENFSGAMTNEFGEGTENVICSKKFGFIKWLVENEKVEWDNKDIAIKEGILGKSIDNYHSLLMLLAIQDEPIRFLCEILK